MRTYLASLIVGLGLGLALPASAQQAHDPAAMIAAQREALAATAMLNGTWRGTAWQLDPTGKRHDMVQTERSGTMLDGSVRMIEGRGYAVADGKLVFNALALISYDTMKKAWSMRSYAMGRSGDFQFSPTADGFTWSVPAGPKATVRYTAVIKDGNWREIGEFLMEGQPPRQVFEMNLKRIGESDWPAGGAVPMK
jgi:hypothetical protein